MWVARGIGSWMWEANDGGGVGKDERLTFNSKLKVEPHPQGR